MEKPNKQNRPLREKLDAFAFDFDAQAWDRMEARLDAEETPKAVWWRWLPLAILLLISAGAGLAYQYFEAGTKNTNSAYLQLLPGLESERQMPPAKTGIAATSEKKNGDQATEKKAAVTSSALTTEAVMHPGNRWVQVASPTPLGASTLPAFSENNQETLLLSEQQPVDTATLYRLNTLGYTFTEVANEPIRPTKVVLLPVKAEEEKAKKKRSLVVRFKEEGEKFSLIPENWGIKLGANSAIVGPRDPSPDGNKEKLVEDAVLGMYFAYNLPGPFSLTIEPTYRGIYSYNITHQDTVHRFGLVHNLETTVGSLTFFDLQAIGQLRYTRRSSFELGASLSRVRIDGYGYSRSTPEGMPPGVTFEEPPRFGIRPWTYSAIIGYEYKLSGRFRCSARYQFGLRDLSDPGLYISQQKHRGSDLQLSMKFQFNKPPKRETW